MNAFKCILKLFSICLKHQTLQHKIDSRVNLIKRLKTFKRCKLNLPLTKTCMRSIFGYCFIISKSSTTKIESDLQKLQNKILKNIKWFPLKTKTAFIHEYFKINTIKGRSDKLFTNYMHKALKLNKQIETEFKNFNANKNCKFISQFQFYVDISNS
jgi:hypothetical protein